LPWAAWRSGHHTGLRNRTGAKSHHLIKQNRRSGNSDKEEFNLAQMSSKSEVCFKQIVTLGQNEKNNLFSDKDFLMKKGKQWHLSVDQSPLY
jgi:hypothetical protein